MVLKGVCAQTDGGERIAQLVRRVGDEAPLTLERGPHRLSHRVERRGEVAQFRRPRHVGGQPGDPFGHLGDGALEPVDGAQHPPRERTSDQHRQHEQTQTADRHPQPAAGDAACRDRGVDRHYDGADQLPVVPDTRGGQDLVAAPRQDAGPPRRRCVDEGTAYRRRHGGFGVAESACGPGSAVAVDDEHAFPVHLVIAVDLTLQGSVWHCGRIGQCSKLPVPFSGKCRGSAIRQTQRQRDRECRYRQKQEDDEDDANSQAHVRRPAENRTRAPSGATTAVPQTSSMSSSRLTASP